MSRAPAHFAPQTGSSAMQAILDRLAGFAENEFKARSGRRAARPRRPQGRATADPWAALCKRCT